MRVIIAGGRDFDDFKLLESTCHQALNQLFDREYLSISISEIKEQIEIVCGKARGADTLGEWFAIKHQLPVKYFPADWNSFGKSAGYRRNKQMAIYASEDKGVLMAFWNGVSKGTKDMINVANKYGLSVSVINY